MPWRLMCVDGADAQRFFPLPDSGSVVIGNSHKYADICLHDLVMARVHCQIDVEEGRVTVTALSDEKETRVNNERITTRALQEGETIRIGNSHLRLEPDPEGRPETVDAENAELVDDEEPMDVVEAVEAVETVEAAPETAEAEPPPLPKLGWNELDKLSGHTLGHFEIGPLLGRGHTGVTFRARDTEAHREVALKVIGPEFPAAPEELQQFARTIRKVATIVEPHLVTWYAAGRTAKYVWISQQFIEGESLTQVLKRGETASLVLKWRNALKLGIDLGQALDGLFQRKIIHGNLTPANVLIGLDREVRLNDLMYEEALRGSQWYNKRLEAKLLAELPYMAPERLEEGAYYDSVADIYSLGALVYARLTSRPPFLAKTPAAMIQAIREGNLVKPREIIRGCPEKFEAVILKMLAHNQEDRYATPAHVLEDLDRLNVSL